MTQQKIIFSLQMTKMDRIRNKNIRTKSQVAQFGDKVRESETIWTHLEKKTVHILDCGC